MARVATCTSARRRARRPSVTWLARSCGQRRDVEQAEPVCMVADNDSGQSERQSAANIECTRMKRGAPMSAVESRTTTYFAVKFEI